MCCREDDEDLFSEIKKAEDKKRLTMLHASRIREMEVNLEEFNQTVGEPVVYGQVREGHGQLSGMAWLMRDPG